MIREATLMIWDEAMMCHRHALEAIDRSFREIRGVNLPFGGIVTVVMGDFRQVLPVVPKASRAQIVAACFSRSRLWGHFQTRLSRRTCGWKRPAARAETRTPSRIGRPTSWM